MVEAGGGDIQECFDDSLQFFEVVQRAGHVVQGLHADGQQTLSLDAQQGAQRTDGSLPCHDSLALLTHGQITESQRTQLSYFPVSQLLGIVDVLMK